jgi:hypothetical protein
VINFVRQLLARLVGVAGQDGTARPAPVARGRCDRVVAVADLSGPSCRPVRVTDSEPEIKRSSTPTARRHNDRMIEVHFELNGRPDDAWRSEFERALDGTKAASSARITLPGEQHLLAGSQRTARPNATTVDFFIGTPEDLAPTVQALDDCIATINQRYVEVVLPAQEARRQREDEDKARRTAEQQQLDDAASQLPPPD